MTDYDVHVIVSGGRLVKRTIEASTPEEARRQAASEGLTVLLVRSSTRITLPSLWTQRFDVRLFSHELVTLLQAGLSLIEALETLDLRNSAGHKTAGDVTEANVPHQLLESLRNGEQLSEAMERIPHVFPEILVATISASEQTGEISRGLERYLQHDEQSSALRAKIVSASLYPAMLLVVGSAVAIFLLIYLVPRFSSVYENLDTELPLGSRLLMQWGTLASHHLGLILTFLAVTIAGLTILLLRKDTRSFIGHKAERARWIGDRIRLIRLTRFYRATGLLLQGGIPLVNVLRITQRLLPEESRQRVNHAVVSIERGLPLSDCLEQVGLSTPVASRLIRAGEQNGQLAEMLDRTAAFHEEEIARWIDAFMKLFEPILMVAIGLFIGMIVILLYLPIFELAGSL